MVRLAAPSRDVGGRNYNIDGAGLRRSPRKKTSVAEEHVDTEEHQPKKGPANGASSHAARRRGTKTPSKTQNTGRSFGLREISLPSTSDADEVEIVISSAQRSRKSRSPSALDAIVAELDGLSLGTQGASRVGGRRKNDHAAKAKSQPHYTSRFVLKEADCVGDYSDQGEGEDEDTDLSGFIVDDDAELSYHETSEGSSEDGYKARKPPSKPRRRLQRGHRRVVDSDSDKENDSEVELAGALGSLRLGDGTRTTPGKAAPEVIDLTSPSPFTSKAEPKARSHPIQDPFCSDSGDLPDSDADLPKKLPSLFDSLLRLSPRNKSSSSSFPSTHPANSGAKSMRDKAGTTNAFKRPQTPEQPRTPPRLKSPSKLLSPSKKQEELRSPHRQSTDAFWDLHTINDWVDVNSPKKAPIDSPRKNPLARFAIWSDGDADDMDAYGSSSSSLPSPCASPTKPLKSPTKAQKAAIAAEKKALKAEKDAKKATRNAFEAIKNTLAYDLLHYLDTHVTGGKLGEMSASTGGVAIIWSKTLRLTAGRANYTRKVEPSIAPSPPSTPPPGAAATWSTDATCTISPTKRVVKYHVNIELSEKVIDCEARIVNTLSHEFCHLANYLVSGNLKDPHGPSFFYWADRAIACLRAAHVPDPNTYTLSIMSNSITATVPTPRPAWQNCTITTKHDYVIDFKYMWACIGRVPQTVSAVQEYLNIAPDPTAQGCGHKYERHSKSIKPEVHRCGRCKGFLIQIKPVPRKSSPKKKDNLRKAKKIEDTETVSTGSGSPSDKSRSLSEDSLTGTLGLMVDVIELSD